jgi:hypothetical protein
MDDQLHSLDNDYLDDDLLRDEATQPDDPPAVFYRSLCIALDLLRRQPSPPPPSAA